jgi:hypothetical protein
MDMDLVDQEVELAQRVVASRAIMTEDFEPVRVEAMTLGDAWIAIAAAILRGGDVGSWDGLPIIEVFRATLASWPR